MIDPLFARAQFAIEEGLELQLRSQMMKTQRDAVREALRRNVFESKMYRSEMKAHRDNNKE
jgi:hypothetical protein